MQILGIGQPGARIRVLEPARIGSMNDIVTIIDKHGAKIRSLVSILPPRVAWEDSITHHEDSLVHLDTKEAGPIVDELTERGYRVDVLSPRDSPESQSPADGTPKTASASSAA